MEKKDGMISLTDEGLEHFEKTLPTSVDLSGSLYWPPIYQQTHWVCNQVAASYYMMTFENAKYNNLDASLEENQFSVYFAWNFGNGGNGWYGDNYVISMEMLKTLGVPFVTEFDADELMDSSKWMTGYDKYYDAMHNQISNYYGISLRTVSGLTTLKSWVFNHAGSDLYGGPATFLANVADGGTSYFEDGTPEEGDYVLTRCADDAKHARTICGFNDFVCYDYNGDGEYTNNIDLNGDGIIDVRDYEKGGFKLAESFGPEWHGTGYCWMMYKCFADRYGDGGILNNMVHVIEPKVNYSPKLTAKLRIKHPSREMIKIKIGISSDLSSDNYEYISGFPILNFQGGDKSMQGGQSEDQQTIEVGLDLTPYLQYFNSESCAKISLEVAEGDGADIYDGEISYFSIIDYTGDTPQEYAYEGTTALINDDITTISVDACLNENDVPQIITEAIPVLSVTESIWQALEFGGGTPPYEWKVLPYFEVTESTREFDSFVGTKLTPDAYFDESIELELPFDFPFLGETTNTIRIHADGYIFPFSWTSPWTQLREYLTPFFINDKVISPLARFSMVCDFDEGDGIFYEIAGDTVKIRWKTSDKSSETWTSAEFGCNLISDGTIEFTYDNFHLRSMFTNIGGVSYGKQDDHIFCFIDEVPPANTLITIKSYPIPENIAINEIGVLYGEINQYSDYPFRVQMKDVDGISHSRIYSLTSLKEDNFIPNQFVSVFPNPVSNNLTVMCLFADDEILSVDVYSQTGELLQPQISNSDSECKINTTNLPSGLYNLRIQMSDIIITRRFIKI